MTKFVTVHEILAYRLLVVTYRGINGSEKEGMNNPFSSFVIDY